MLSMKKKQNWLGGKSFEKQVSGSLFGYVCFLVLALVTRSNILFLSSPGQGQVSGKWPPSKIDEWVGPQAPQMNYKDRQATGHELLGQTGHYRPLARNYWDRQANG